MLSDLALEFDKAARYRDEIRRIEGESSGKSSILAVPKKGKGKR